MRTPALAAVTYALLAAACGSTTQLEPAAGAVPAPGGVGEGAVAMNAGVTMEVRAEAWRGEPAKLATEITPLFIEVTNNSTHPLLMRYQSVKLTQNGKTYYALPPYDIEGNVTERLTVSEFPYAGFTVAPYLSRYYPRLVVADPFYWDRAFYTRMVPAFRRVALPTGDMVQKALPEGVLAPGSKVAGFVYFEDVDDDIPEVTFTAELVDASSQTEFGQIEIPFRAH